MSYYENTLIQKKSSSPVTQQIEAVGIRFLSHKCMKSLLNKKRLNEIKRILNKEKDVI